MSRLAEKKSKRKRRLRNFFILTGLMLTFSLLIFAGYIAAEIYSTWNTIQVDRLVDEEEQEKKVDISKPFTVLIMGVDAREDELYGRSDTLMLAIVNPTDKEISLLSIPRDTYVMIHGLGRYDKINHAYAYGGVNTAIKTVEEFLDIPIDHFIAVNFDAFRSFIDIMGGIVVDVEREMYHQRARGDVIHLQPGRQILNGDEALYYVRFRGDSEGDFGRIRRQQQVIKEILNQTMSLRTVTKIGEILDAIGENVKHDIPFTKMVKLTNKFSSLSGENVNVIPMEGVAERVDGIWYVFIDEEEQRRVQADLKMLLNQDMKYHQPRNYTHTENEQY